MDLNILQTAVLFYIAAEVSDKPFWKNFFYILSVAWGVTALIEVLK